MAWVESHQAVGHHPKTIQLAQTLKIPLPTAVGYLHYLWWWALDYAQDGRITARDAPSVIAHACEYRGKPDAFWNALVESGFIDQVNGTASLHDWMDYAGKLTDQRMLRRASNRQAQARRRQQLSSPGQHVSSLTQQPVSADSPHDVDDSQHPTGPNQPDQPTGLVSVNRSPARPRDAAPFDPAGRRVVAAERQEPRPGAPSTAQQCPMCHGTFIGPYSDHYCEIGRPPRSLGAVFGNLKKAKKLSARDQAAVDAELAEMAQRKAELAESGEFKLPPELAAEDARLRALEQSRRESREHRADSPVDGRTVAAHDLQASKPVGESA